MADSSFGKLFGLDNDETKIEPLELDQPTPQPLEQLHDVGQDTERAAQDEQIAIQEETSTLEMVGAAFDKNIGPMAWDVVQRKWEHEAEPDFDPQQYLEENQKILPAADLSQFADVRSRGEADELREDLTRQKENAEMLEAHGVSGMAAQLIVGMVDVDLPATLLTGGAFASGKMTAKALLKSTAAGATAGAGTMALSTSVDPLGDTKDIVYGALLGSSLGIAGGAIGSHYAKKANNAMDSARNDFNSAIDDLPQPDDVSEASVYSTPDPAMEPLAGPSVGAGSRQAGIDYSQLNEEQGRIIGESVNNLASKGIAARLDDPDFVDTPIGRTAKRFSDALQKLPEGVMTDFDRLANSGVAVDQNLAYELFESAEGRIVNNRSAAMLQENYGQRISSEAMDQIEPVYTAWAKQNKIGSMDKMSDSTRDLFHRELISEMEGRWQGEGSQTNSAAIKQLADALDRQNELARKTQIGRDGETSVFGSEHLEQRSGYVPHSWDGKAIRKLMTSKGISRGRIEEFVEKQFTKMYPHVAGDDAKVVSRAVIRRALNKEDGVDANMLSTLDADGVHILTDVLTDAGISQKRIDDMVERLRGKQSEQGMQGSSKKRINFDMRASDGEISMMDLIDTNVTRLYTRYNRKVAGASALARKGITGTGDRKAIIDASIAERNARGLEVGDKQRKYLEDIFTYFDAGPIGGGVDPLVGRMKRLTNLALLNQMGLTQLMETGAQMSAVGVQTWGKHAKVVMDELVRGGPEGPMAMELKPLMGKLGKEHLLERPDLMMDELRENASNSAEFGNWLDKFDNVLGKGQRVQGLLSGFYAVKGIQQKIAATSMADKIAQRVRDGVDENALRDIGIDPSMVKKYVANGKIEFDTDGTTSVLNLQDWDVQDAEDFVLALHRHTNKVVQKAMAGEETMWMHKTVGSMYMHLKTFPLLAMRKQFIRNGGVSTDAFVGTLMMGFGTAALFGAAKQVINGKGGDLSAEKVVTNALNMGNMTGWFPMLADPAAAILGYDISAYGRHGIDQGVIALPPAIPTLNKMAHIIGAVNPASELSDNERIRALQTTPIVGNLYGFSAMFNAMKD
ncbi:MAG: hypothetical protein HRU11_10855 [Parvularculaceae bacterium]|nr:hypothetical protein [Parvularculaceae bacterium]